MTLNGSRFFALAFLRGFLVELAATQFCEDAGFLAGALKTPQRGVEIFVFPDLDLRHCVLSYSDDRGHRIE